jgi:hypothetical protein
MQVNAAYKRRHTRANDLPCVFLAERTIHKKKLEVKGLIYKPGVRSLLNLIWMHSMAKCEFDVKAN